MNGFHCKSCGEYHDEMPRCFGASAPAMWLAMSEEERATRAEISTDQCIIDDQYYFVLGRIALPVLDSPEPFVWLAWISLSESNFLRCSELWDTPGRETEPAYFGWLQSSLPTYTPSTLNLKTSVQTMPIGERPIITIEPSTHPLAIEQLHGITRARVQEIAEFCLHG
ncbi:DUF2199 domain-containing protein [Undibacterium cyanobacteriorum]|uniref:DUF2199 domain-containing protein n=1 Tax=Undibacterium cyanobacteriorum TaxID=3073561 RepID=A0ABY9RJN2_9BURK|nr:DUF2199 domain-containing protein [Undibacterium sp. 20NA77.5]WMW80874.1 DUF2199 domain-containing protein [Undibacterium sp. 20NA77.5]